MSESQVTVIISNYNYAQFVGCAIESCLKQTVKPQIIVVDDASTDSSWDEIVKYKQLNFKAVQLKTNSGGNAKGKNIGILLSKTKYVTCLDSDDLLLPSSIEQRLSAIEKYQVDWVHGTAIPIASKKGYKSVLSKVSGNIVAKNLLFYQLQKRNMKLPEHNINWYMCVEASTVLTTRKIYDVVGLYDERLKWKIDREMWNRFLLFGMKKRFINTNVSIYRKHKLQATQNTSIKDPKEINEQFDRILKTRHKYEPIKVEGYNLFKNIDKIVG